MAKRTTMIPQSLLGELNQLDLKIEGARHELKRLELSREHLSEHIEVLLDAGVACEQGPLYAEIDKRERRVPKWKDEFARVAGPKAVEDVMTATEPSVTTKVIILQR